MSEATTSDLIYGLRCRGGTAFKPLNTTPQASPSTAAPHHEQSCVPRRSTSKASPLLDGDGVLELVQVLGGVPGGAVHRGVQALFL